MSSPFRCQKKMNDAGHVFRLYWIEHPTGTAAPCIVHHKKYARRADISSNQLVKGLYPTAKASFFLDFVSKLWLDSNASKLKTILGFNKQTAPDEQQYFKQLDLMCLTIRVSNQKTPARDL